MIRFNVIGQTLKRTDEFTPASDSVEFLKAQFNIVSDEWDGYALTALFRHYETGVTYRAVCDFDGVCVVPWEVLTKPAKSRLNPKYCRFYVTLTGNKGASVATTNEFEVEMRISGYTEGETPAEPTPDAYAQYVEVVKAEADRVETAAADVKSAAETVEKSVETVENIAKSNETTAGIIKNSAANAFKGVASGEVVRVDDVSCIEHTVKVKVQGENIDPSTVTLTRCGKNLVKYPYFESTKSEEGITFTDNGDGSIAVNGTATGGSYFNFIKQENIKIEQPITISIIGDCDNIILVLVVDGTVKHCENPYTLTSGVLNTVAMLVNPNITVTKQTVRATIELGKTATNYEAYKGTTYTPNADGTCDVVSVSPTMTLLTDTEGITIECEYNRDTNIVMGDIETAIDGILAIQNAIIGGDYS